MALKSNFEIVKTDKNSVTIRDIGPWDEFLSVTNDIENVIEYLYNNLPLGDRKLFYYDTEGIINEVMHKDGEFIDFILECYL